MAIKVVFPAGTASITVGGLFQWDYGQVLEIESAEIGSEIVEVHFACQSMSEAVVRPCTFANGVGTVAIPDQCLEQSSEITAWVFEITGTHGRTIKTITLRVTARKRPAKIPDVPVEYVNKYAELITEINEAVDALENGNVKAAKAANADNAAYATAAGNAESANYATSAGQATAADRATRADQATKADSASKATKADSATSANWVEKVTNLVASAAVVSGSAQLPSGIKSGELYLVVFKASDATHSGVFCWNSDTDRNCGRIGVCEMDVRDGEIAISHEGMTAQNIAGALKFYKIGGEM